MKKSIILNESTFKRLTHYMMTEANDKNMADALLRFNKYKSLGNDYFKNPNIKDDVRANDQITYNNALKTEMNDIVETIYTVFEKIAHNLNALYANATNEDPKNGEKVNYVTKKDNNNKWMHPSTFYVENDISNVKLADKKDFFYKCRCYYTLILRVYNGGIPVWANLFFNPKYKAAKEDFIKCNQISTGKLARISVGILNKETNSYPEGSINWIRNKRANSETEKTYGDSSPILTKDFQPSTFGQTQYDQLIPKNEKSAIMQWYIKAQKDPSMYEEYIITEPKSVQPINGKRRFGVRK